MSRYKKRHKPRRKKIEYKGQTMASQSEVRFAKGLDDRRIPWEYESDEIKWTQTARVYTPDFKITRKDRTEFFVEYKGFLWTEDKQKMKAVKEQHPDIDIRFVFADAHKPVHGAKTRKDGTKMSHAEWAEKTGYLWAHATIPASWLKTQPKGKKK